MEEIKEFLEKNKEAFKVLQKHVKALDTVKGVNTVTEFKARQKAISVVNEWLIELWGIAYPELPEAEEDDDIYRTIIKS
jgi:hypothetical protein